MNDFSYKNAPINNSKAMIVSALESDNDVDVPDPPVEPTPIVSLDLKTFKILVTDAQEDLRKGNRDKVIDSLILINNYIPTFFQKGIPPGFTRETDFCRFLLQVAANDTDIEFQFYAIRIIADIMYLSNDVVEEFIEFNAINFFNQLTYNRNNKIRKCAFKILKYCVKSEKGFRAFINEGLIQKYISLFTALIEISNPEKPILKCISLMASTFCQLLQNIKEIPNHEYEAIFNCLVNALRIRYHLIFKYALLAAMLCVQGLGSEGTKIIRKSKLFDCLPYFLNLEHKTSCFMELKLLEDIFAQREPEEKSKILKMIGKETLPNLLLNIDPTDKLYQTILSIITNSYNCEMDFSWVIRKDFIQKFSKILDEGSYENKKLVVRLILLTLTISDNDICNELLKCEICVDIIQVIQSFRTEDIILALKIIGKLYHKILRYGLFTHENFNNEIIILVKQFQMHEDQNIAQISTAIIENYFPEEME